MFDFTQDFNKRAGMIRASCPFSISLRASHCDPRDASMPIKALGAKSMTDCTDLAEPEQPGASSRCPTRQQGQKKSAVSLTLQKSSRQRHHLSTVIKTIPRQTTGKNSDSVPGDYISSFSNWSMVTAGCRQPASPITFAGTPATVLL